MPTTGTSGDEAGALVTQLETDASAIIDGEFSEPIEINFNDGAQDITVKLRAIIDETFTDVNEEGIPFVSEIPRAIIQYLELEELIAPNELPKGIEDNWTLTRPLKSKTFLIKYFEKDGTTAVIRLQHA